MAVSRRTCLALGGGGGLAALSGCLDFGSETPQLSLTLLNFDSERHEIDVEVFLADAEEYTDAVVLRERYELSPPPEGAVAAERTDDDALESDTYVVDVAVSTAPAVSDTYHFYPALVDDDDRTDRLFIELRTDPDSGDRYIDFQQNH
ncbi:hypothetical protein [Haloterrigena salifodinae]|uniref:hypothetical protein n=1 Tax=Haloterrigena salifodinae TaxID=2675099 RepID=UPI000F887DCD|nr:hypothetical protein [Haloterrigena salifodinae]